MGSEIVIAIIAALSGGGIFKFLDFILGRRKNTFDEGKAFRDEYRQRIDDLEEDMAIMKEALKEEQKEKDRWKREYNKLFYQFQQYQIEILATFKKNELDTADIQIKLTYVED